MGIHAIPGTIIDTLPLDSTAAEYSGADYPIYSRNGRTVILWGAVKPTSTVAAGDTLAVGKLPEGYRPRVSVVNICQGSGTAIFATRVYPSGSVTVERYRDSSGYKQMTTSTWLPLYISFQI